MQFIQHLLLILSVLLLSAIPNAKNKNASLANISAFERMLKNGDLIFRRGLSIESDLVCLAEKESTYSHVGMIMRIHQKPYVIHSVPGEAGQAKEFIRLEPVADFLSPAKASHFGFYRALAGDSAAAEAARQAYLFYQKHYVFDNDYDLTTESSLYCTELIIKAYNNAGIFFDDITPSRFRYLLGEKNIILPGTIIKSKSFFRILNQ